MPTMKGLDRQQRDYLADFCAKFALIIAGGFIISQVVPDQQIDLPIVAIGIVLTLGVIVYGTYLRKLI